MINLHNPTLTIIDGIGVITGYSEKEPIEKKYKEKPWFFTESFEVDHKKWLESKFTYPVEEGSVEDLELIHFDYYCAKNPHFSNSNLPTEEELEKDLANGFDITSIMDRLELTPNFSSKIISEYVVQLIPQQIKSEEIQEDLIEELRLIFQDRRISYHQQNLSILHKFTITPKQ